MPQEIPKAYEPQEIEERWAQAWYDEKLFRAENSGTHGGPMNAFRSRCRRRMSPARSTSGTCSSTPKSTCWSAGTACAASARCGCRGWTTPASPRNSSWSACSRKRNQAAGFGTRRIRAARVEMEGGERRRHQAADDSPGRFLRLDARKIHAGAGAVSLGARSVFAAVPRRIDLSRALHGQLVPALPDGDQRSGSGAQRAHRKFVAHALSGCRATGERSIWWWRPRGPRRCWAIRRWPSIRTTSATQQLIGQEGDAAADEPRNSDHRGCVRGPRIRHRRGENHAGARSERLREWASGTTCRKST